MKKYFYAERGRFWDVFPAAIVVTGKKYEAFPVIRVDMFGSHVNPNREGDYYEKGDVTDLSGYQMREVTPSFFGILTN